MQPSLERMQVLMGRIFIFGVAVSSLIVLAGGTLYLIRHGEAPVHYQIFRGEPIELRSIAGVAREAGVPTGRGLIQLGLVLLVAVQVLRVSLTVWLFYTERDWKFCVISLTVLAVLAYSLFGRG